MEKEGRINWLGLFIKIIIIFIFIIIIVWLISKILGAKKLSDTFKNNINNMQTVAVDYFKTIDLPQKKGDSIKVTLDELMDKELIFSVNNDKVTSCDTKDSFSKITRGKKEYTIKTTLKCGKEKDTIKTSFPFEDCRNCNENIKNDNSSTNNNESNNTNTQVGVTYYEYVKEKTEYTKWMRGSLTGKNIENKYEYYGVDYQTYYSLGAIPSSKKSISYTLKLDKVPNSKYYFTIVEETSNYTKEEENNYLNEKNLSLYKGNKINTPNKDIYKYSLGKENFTYKLSPYYREGSFYVRVTITVNNTKGVQTYYDSKLKENAYLVPLKLNIKFSSNKLSETKPSGEYETISYYRYVTTSKETIWSNKTSVDGYKRTGKTEVR